MMDFMFSSSSMDFSSLAACCFSDDSTRGETWHFYCIWPAYGQRYITVGFLLSRMEKKRKKNEWKMWNWIFMNYFSLELLITHSKRCSDSTCFLCFSYVLLPLDSLFRKSSCYPQRRMCVKVKEAEKVRLLRERDNRSEESLMAVATTWTLTTSTQTTLFYALLNSHYFTFLSFFPSLAPFVFKFFERSFIYRTKSQILQKKYWTRSHRQRRNYREFYLKFMPQRTEFVETSTTVNECEENRWRIDNLVNESKTTRRLRDVISIKCSLFWQTTLRALKIQFWLCQRAHLGVTHNHLNLYSLAFWGSIPKANIN